MLARWSSSKVASVLCCVILASLAVAGCARPDAARARTIARYFAANNAAARHGPAAQQEFLRRTQHPDFRETVCELAGMTVTVRPAWATLRRDPEFTVDGRRPRGRIRVVSVEVTVRRDRSVVARQIGSQHVVLLDGRAHGFAPCPA